MTFKRILRYGMTGSDVRYIRDLLLSLGYGPVGYSDVSGNVFDEAMLAAVKQFQRANLDLDGKQLFVDGIVGQKTWDAIVRAPVIERDTSLPATIGKLAGMALTPALARVSDPRRAFMLLALQFAYDPTVPAKYPHSLYIRGGNLYHTDLALNVITAARIDAGAKRQPAYYSNGRAEMMKAAVANNPGISGADCSGGIVGLLRKFALVRPTFDTIANALTGDRYSVAVSQDALLPGDYVGRPGHIGLYAGGGYVVEWMGGAYGCQLSILDDRRGYNFVSGRTVAKAPWTKFRRPDVFA